MDPRDLHDDDPVLLFWTRRRARRALRPRLATATLDGVLLQYSSSVEQDEGESDETPPDDKGDSATTEDCAETDFRVGSLTQRSLQPPPLLDRLHRQRLVRGFLALRGRRGLLQRSQLPAGGRFLPADLVAHPRAGLGHFMPAFCPLGRVDRMHRCLRRRGIPQDCLTNRLRDATAR